MLLVLLGAISCKNPIRDNAGAATGEEKISDSAKTNYSFLSKDFIENYEYRIEEKKIILKNGSGTSEHDTYSIVEYATGDINNDRIKDLFVLIKNNSQGSGTFYYTNLFVGNSKEKLSFVEEKFIGDRIKPTYISIYQKDFKHPLTDLAIHPDDYGKFSLGYYIHGSDQSYSEDPKFYMTPTWKLINGVVERIAQE